MCLRMVRTEVRMFIHFYVGQLKSLCRSCAMRLQATQCAESRTVDHGGARALLKCDSQMQRGILYSPRDWQAHMMLVPMLEQGEYAHVSFVPIHMNRG